MLITVLFTTLVATTPLEGLPMPTGESLRDDDTAPTEGTTTLATDDDDDEATTGTATAQHPSPRSLPITSPPLSVGTSAPVVRAPIDREPPVVTITAPAAAAITVIERTPTAISGTASDDVALTSVRWQLEGPAVGNGALPTTGAWSHTFTSLRPGTYTFRVTAVDTAGKPSTARTRTIVVVKAGTPPPIEPPPAEGDPDSGDIRKDARKCGIGSGFATFLLLMSVTLAVRGTRRRIE